MDESNWQAACFGFPKANYTNALRYAVERKQFKNPHCRFWSFIKVQISGRWRRIYMRGESASIELPRILNDSYLPCAWLQGIPIMEAA